MHEFRKLTEGVYAFLQPALIWYSSAGVIIGDRDVIVVDSLTNQAMARFLLEEISKVTDKPIKTLINTHSHADHVYTNHLFPSATVICSATGREKTREFQQHQSLHDATFARLFPDVDFDDGHYTLQDMAFTGTLSLYRNEREIRVIELGPGHSESDVIVHLPDEKIVFCGDVFVNGLPPMPGEGHITTTIANLRVLENLQAHIYVAGHGRPGTLKDITEQRILLETLARRSRACFDQGLSYDEAIKTFVSGPLPVEFARPAVLSGYCEWGGVMPASSNQADTNHLEVLLGVAREARRLLPD